MIPPLTTEEALVQNVRLRKYLKPEAVSSLMMIDAQGLVDPARLLPSLIERQPTTVSALVEHLLDLVGEHAQGTTFVPDVSQIPTISS